MTTTLKEALAVAAARRAELELALDRIDDKVNLPKKVRRAYARAQDSYVRNPFPWILGAAGAVITAAGLIVWVAVKDD